MAETESREARPESAAAALTEGGDAAERLSPAWVFFTGLCMGAADVVPGVSGGTMAFIMGVYQQLIDAIRSVNVELLRLVTKLEIRKAFEHLSGWFLIALGAGILTSVLVLSGQVEWALHHQRVLLFAFFFGLVVASIVSLASKIKWSVAELVWFAVGGVTAWLLVGMLAKPTPDEPWMAFVAGSIGITAMILPGISGSFILLILGQYANVIAAINDLKGGDLGALTTLVPFGLGMVVGILIFSRILGWLLDRFYLATVALMTGFITGSLRKIWPFKGEVLQSIEKKDEVVEIRANALPDVSSHEFLWALGLAVVGFVFITVVDHLHSKRNPIVLLVTHSGGASPT